MPTVRTVLGASSNAAPTRATLRTFPKMGPRLHWPIHTGYGTHGEQVHSCSNRLLHQVGGNEGVERQYGIIYNKIPLRELLVQIWLPHRIYQRPRRSFFEFLNRQAHLRLRRDPRKEYTVLPVGEWSSQIHQQNITEHSQKNRQRPP